MTNDSSNDNNSKPASGKIAEAGRDKERQKISKDKIKGMSSYQAAKILSDHDPDMLKKIEKEVAEQARVIKRKIIIAGAVIVAGIAAFVAYTVMNQP